MTICVIAKLLGTVCGLIVCWFWPQHEYTQAAAVGILPIWFELAATYATGIEPSLETRPAMKYADAAVDAFCFLLVPAGWLYSKMSVLPLSLTIALFFFLSCGFFRLGRFLRRGLVRGQYFEGVPVTYFGYLWLPIWFLVSHGRYNLAALVLLLCASCMVNPKIKIPRTNPR